MSSESWIGIQSGNSGELEVKSKSATSAHPSPPSLVKVGKWEGERGVKSWSVESKDRGLGGVGPGLVQVWSKDGGSESVSVPSSPPSHL